MLMKRATRAVCLVALLAALSAPLPLAAQVLYGSLVGNVTDASDAAVPNATVTLTNKQTGAVRTAQTNETGVYSIPTVQSGLYSVRVTREGFRAVTQDNIEVAVNAVVRQDFKLNVGQVTETVVVEAQAASLQTDRAEVRSEMTSKALTEIPVPGQRNYQALLITLPGISPPETPHSIPSNPSRSMQFASNGNNFASNNTRIDGASATNIWLPHIASYVPALESIETVNVVTNSFDAEQGLAGGAAVNVIIRSGTNDFNGALFHYHQGNWSQARNFFLPSNQDVPKFVFNQFGGRAGGAIVKNKLFYFGSYEGTTDRRFAFGLYSVPTPAMRAGDYSNQSGLGAAQRSIIVDPLSGATSAARIPFAGNVIPNNRLNPTALRLMRDLPPENLPNAQGLPAQNFFGSAPASLGRHTIDSKVNYNINEKWTMFARLSWLDFSMLSQTPFGDQGGPPITFGNPGVGSGGTWSGSLATTYTVTPNFVIDANFGYTRMITNVEQPGLGPNTCRDDLRIPGANGSRRFESGLCGFGIGGLTVFGSTESYMPYFRDDPQYQYVANANWQKGRHNIRFGMDIYHLQLNHQQPEFTGGGDASAAGRLNFGQGPTQQGVGNVFNSHATFMLGHVTGGGRLLQVPDVYRTRTSMFSFYARDQWQVTRNLTLSYGARFESFPMPWREGSRGMERYDFTTNQMIACGVGGNPRDCGTDVAPVYISPRLGIAYRPTDKWVIRSGFGFNYDPWNLARPLRTNFPVLLVQNFAAPAFQWASNLPGTPANSVTQVGLPILAEPVIGQNGRIALPNNFNVVTTGDRFQRSYIMNWNLTVEHDLGKNWIGQVGYVGSRAARVSGSLNLNAGQVIGADQAGQPLFPRFGRAVSTNLVTAVGDTNYHSLQTTLRKRFSAGLQTNFAYTWSKTIGICCNTDNNGGPAVSALAFMDRNRAVMPFDRTHNFQVTAMYELPFGKGKRFGAGSSAANALLGGWQLNTAISLMSGLPFNVTADGATLLMPGSQQQPDLVGDPAKLGGIGRGNPFFDRAAFREVPRGAPRFGNLGINALRGPGFFNSDLGLFRQFRFSERFNMQFRAEMFNWTNTPKFSNPQGSINSADFMFITSTFNNGREPNGDRIMRLGLRLSF